MAIGGTMVTILRQAGAIAAHIGPREMKNAHPKAFNTSDFPFDVGDCRHDCDLRL
jgi:hypothetical protein